MIVLVVGTLNGRISITDKQTIDEYSLNFDNSKKFNITAIFISAINLS